MISIPDMHTHSQFSHDSDCVIETMLLSQIEKGTKIFAVTDHLDMYQAKKTDIFTPIRQSNVEAKRISEKYADSCLVLSGYEISEAFYEAEEYKKVNFDCDVVIGSVHCVRYPEYMMPYSLIDFSVFSDEMIYEYLDTYFDDVITMFDTTDFDILAHLTCPLRYIVGKYGRKVDMFRFDAKIERILKRTVSDGKAFEINTSSFGLLGDFMPSGDIIKKYYSLGGRLITVGSDAHVPENASLNFDKAIGFIKEVGFENVYYFKDRKSYSMGVNS